jgi:hypothetical protein
MTPIPPRRYWQTGAEFSPCDKYRYTLWRDWTLLEPTQRKRLCVVGLNPSTADAHDDDPTIRRCIDFAQRGGYSGLLMVNMFAYRSTDSLGLLDVVDPEGPVNRRSLEIAAKGAARTVMAWGSHTKSKAQRELVTKQAERVTWLLTSWAKELGVFGYCDDGQPRHPLFLKKETQVTLVPCAATT